MEDRVRFALEKLLNIAHQDTGQGRRVANFLLAWWNANRVIPLPEAMEQSCH